MAAAEKKIVERHASLIFTDESGFLLLPLVRRSLAPIGQTPVLRHRARQRDKISVAAALTLSFAQGHVSLYHQTFVNQYVTGELYSDFLRHVVLRHVPNAAVLLHDQGSMHKGPHLRQLCRDLPRLDLNFLPAYAPEYNPVEYLWNFEKDKELSNFVPRDLHQLHQTVERHLQKVRHDQARLRSFFSSTPLPWKGLTVFF